MADIDYNKWRLFFEVFVFVWNLAIGLYLWFGRSQKDVIDRIERFEEAVDQRLDAYDQKCQLKQERIARLEQQMKETPTHDDLGQIYDRMNHIAGDVREMKGVLDGTARSVDRIHRYLLEHNKG
ncbi:MAG TPA: hypothetical protein VNL74_00900 [Methylococcus sp.]|nr:hypothetical protein [Methylococcus sp.]